MTPLELGHLNAFGAMTGTGKWMWLRLGRGELRLPPRALPGTPGVLSPPPRPCFPGRGGPCPPLGRDPPCRAPQRLSRGFHRRSFCNGHGGSRLYCLRAWPAPAHGGHHWPLGAAAAPALALQAGADEEPRLGQQKDFGGSLGWWHIVPRPALQICGSGEMCGLFWGVGVRCLSGRSLLCSFSHLRNEFLFLIAAPG